MKNQLYLYLLCLVALCGTNALVAQTYLTEDFESAFSGSPAAPTGWTQSRYANAGDFTIAAGNTAGPKDWERNTWTGAAWSSASTSTPPTGAQSGTGVLWMNDAWFAGIAGGSIGAGVQERRLESPTVNLGSSTNPYLTFFLWHNLAVNSQYHVRIMASNDNGATWKIIGYALPNAVQNTSGGSMIATTPWQKVSIKIPNAYKVANAKIGFSILNGYTTTSQNIWIDNVSVAELSPNTITSAASGNWNNPATWVGGVVPDADNHVVIAAGHTVTQNQNATRVQNLTVDGTLNFATGSAVTEVMYIYGNLTINSGGSFVAANTTLSNGKWVFLGGNLLNNGTADFSRNGCVLTMTGGDPVSVSGTGTYTNTTASLGRLTGFWAAATGGITFNSAATITGQFYLLQGQVNPNGNLTLGDNGVTTTQALFVFKGSFSSAPTFAALTGARNLAYQNFPFGDATAITYNTGEEIPLVSSVRTVAGTLLLNTYNNVALSYPLQVGNGTIGGINFTRGILISTPTNIIRFTSNVATGAGVSPSLATPTTSAGSYIAGPVRIDFPTTASTTRNFPLGDGVNFNNASGTSMTPVANALRTVTLATGATGFAAGASITASIAAAPSGAVNAPLSAVIGDRAYLLNANGGPDLPATATIAFNFMNTASPIPTSISDNVSGNQADLRVAQASSLTGTWTQRSLTSGTGTFANNTLYSRSTATAAPGPVSLANGGYFAWGTVGIALDMSATALAAPATVGCFGTTETVSVTIKNNGIYTVNFATTPVTVNASATNPLAVLTNFPPVVVNTGTLAAGATMNVVVSTNYNMSTLGGYTFNASTSVTGDGVPANDAMPATLVNWNTLLTGLTAVANPSTICAGSSTTLSTSPAYSTTGYSVSSIPYVLTPTPGTGVTTLANAGIAATALTAGGLDDGYWAITLPFSFTFYGTTYNAASIGTNGNVQFGALSTVGYGTAFPSVNAPNGVFAALMGDLNTNVGTVEYFVTGTAPNRVLVINWTNVNWFVAIPSASFQAKLYESSNILETHITSCTAGNTHLVAIEDQAGTTAVQAPGRTLGNWAVTVPEAWRFVPPIAAISYSWSPATGLSSATAASPTASPTSTTTYSVTVTALGCSVPASVTVNVSSTPPAPSTTGASICGVGTASLSASGTGGTLSWLASNQGGPVLATGNTYSPTVGTTTTFYVFETAGASTQNVGLTHNAAGILAFASATSNYQTFDVLSGNGIVIQTVDIVPNAATPLGTPIAIQLQNSAGVNIGNPITAVTTTQGAVQTLTLNLFVPQGTAWRLVPVQNPNLQYHQSGFANPYTLPGQVSITGWGPPNATTLYVFFYNWSVRTACYSPLAPVTATVTSPPALTITPASGSYCGTGSVSLAAAGTGYTSFTWTPATGLNTTTGANVVANPSATTAYLCTASGAGCADTQTVTITVNPLPSVSLSSTAITTVCPSSTFPLTATAASTSIKQVGFTQNSAQVVAAPYNGGNTSIRTQMLFTQAELNAAGLIGPSNINTIGWFVSNKLSTGPYQNFTISIAHTPTTAFATTTYVTTGFTTVFTGNVTTALGWNMHNLTTPFAWDGVSSIIVNVCFTNTAVVGFDQCFTSNTGANRVINANLLSCTAATGVLSLERPNTRFMGGAVNYSWSPSAGLSSTIIPNPIVTASATNGAYSYTCTVTDPATGCTNSATYNFTVSSTPQTATISIATPGANNFCPAGGSVTLQMSGTTTANLQWQSSPAGAGSWTNIGGATSTSYTTPLITSSTDYRLQLSCGSTSNSNVITITVGTPSILSTTPGSRCGPGTVNLQATSNGFVNWYTAPTGGTLVGSGNNFTTPSITTTTTYYAEAWSTGGTSTTLPLPTTYCTPTVGFTGATTDYIDDFVFGTLSNIASGDNPADWAIYPQTTTVQAGQTYAMSIKTGITFAQGVGVWIDYNQDGLFTGVGEFVYASPTSGAATTYTTNVTIPLTVASGQTRVRVAAKYFTLVVATESCGHTTFGEYEDYIITMMGGGAVLCTSPTRVPAIATVNPLPTPTLTSNAPICEGGTLNLNASTSLGTGPYGYSWTGPNGFNSSTQNPSLPSITLVNAGTYSVTITDAIPCSATTSTVVAINAVPVISSSTISPTAICTGGTLTLNATATAGFTGYNVVAIPYTPPINMTGATAGPTGDDQVLNVPIGFTFGYYGTNYTTLNLSSNGNVQFVSANTSFIPQAIPTAGGTMDNFIGFPWLDFYPPGGGNVSYRTVGTAPNRTFVVSFNKVATYPTLNNLAEDTVQLRLYETTNVIEVYIKQLGSTNNKVLGIENTAGTAGVVAPGRQLGTWTVSTPEAWRFSPAGVTYSWTGPNSYSSTNNINSIPNITPTQTGLYSLVVTNTLGCTTTVSANVTISPNPTPVITVGGPTTVCSGNAVSLDAGSPYNSYSWSNGATTQIVSAGVAGSYTVTVVDANLCTGTSAPVIVSVLPAPTGVTATASTNNICLPGTLSLTGTGNATGTPLYSWISTPSGFSSAVASPTSFTPATGNITYTLIVTDTSSGCTQSASTSVVNVGTATNASIVYSGSNTICSSDTMTLIGSSPSAATLSYQWYLGGNPISGAQGITYQTQTSGSYTVEITEVLPPFCTSTSSATVVNVNPAATANAGADITSCALGAINLTGSIGGGATVGTWSGNFAGNFSSLTNPAAVYSPAASEVGTSFTLILTTDDPDGTGPCTTVSDSMDITLGGFSTTVAPPTSIASPWIADYEQTEATGWTHYYDNAGTPTNYCDDYLILSVKDANTGGNNIGNVGNPGFEVKVAGQGTYTLSNSTTPYVSPGVTWYVMGRYWDLTPVNQPLNDVNVKFYFTAQDYNDINTVSPYVSASPADMVFYKINNDPSGTPSFDPDPSLLHAGVPAATPFAYNGTGYWEYLNGASPTTSEWLLDAVGANYSAEYIIDRFSGGGGGGGGIVPGAFPVDLLSFSGFNSKEVNILKWTASRESNNKEFILLQSYDKVNFQQIAVVPSVAPNGTSETPTDYTAEDRDFATVTYYRLKQRDLDGLVRSISGTVEITVNQSTNTVVAVYPNPVKETLNLSITQPESGKYRIEVYDMMGRLVMSQREELVGGNTVVQLGVGTLAKGKYNIMVKNANDGTIANTHFVRE